ncbi:MAG TPA: hypothetical protein VHI10_10085 [Mycobacterium sp.]|nr:hypothetical protein [Mycobacterium sp.]
MIELSEQTIIDHLVERLASRYPEISATTVSSVVHDIYSRYDGRPLRDYVPLFVERNATAELDRLGAGSGARTG